MWPHCRLKNAPAMHNARVCRRGSLVKLCGLTRIKFLQSAHLCWLDAMRAAGMGTTLLCWPGHPRSSLPSSTRRRQWLNRRSGGGTLSPTYKAFQMTVRGNYCRSALFACLVCTGEQRAHVEMCVQLFMCDIGRSLGDAISQGWLIRDRYRDIA